MRHCIIYIIYITLVACEEKPDNASKENISDSDEDLIDHVETTLDFRGNIRKLFTVELGLESRGRNRICSPLSAMIPLAKLLIGAAKKSKSETELLQAIGLKKTSELKSTYKQALKEIQFLKGVEVTLASRIYISRNFKLTTKFKIKTERIFGSAIELVDASDPSAVVQTVNKWISDHTNQMITKLISTDDVSPNFSVLLANAIYFKGSWKNPFRQAKEGLFYTPSGASTVPLMKISGNFNYFQCDDLNAQIIELPYVGEQSAMIIVLPAAKNGLPILLRSLKVSTDLLNNGLMKMKTAVVDVTMPKFKIETTIDLKQYYKKMGVVHSLLKEESGLKEVVIGQTMYISNGIQKAIIEVTETGTTASAASAVIGYGSSKDLPIQFIADHPFLFYIRAQHEQLFAGIVNSP